ncbi:MAG: hypothetical protein HQL87_14105 [Magnetococcales bacterium]|nr:hypothetical protein [Magnetococcales bacterium]
MGLSMFQVKKGISLDGIQVIAGSGAPGAAGDASLAPQGSLYLDFTNGQMFVKKASGVGTDKWIRTQDKSDMDAALQGLSWREPVTVHVTTTYTDLAAAETAMNTRTLDGQTIVANDRILFTGITGANQNVFIVTGTPGSVATLVEDTNTATKGDSLYVQAGTDGGKQYSFNGTIWVQQGAASSTEIAYLQAFIGKSGDGNELPDYSSNHVVADNDNLETAVGKLDAQIGVITDNHQTHVFVDPAATVSNNISTLDYQLSLARTLDQHTNVGGGTQCVVGSIDTQGSTTVFGVEWTVAVRLTSNSQRRWMGKVMALVNSTDFDSNISGVLTLGAAIPGLDVSVDLSGSTLRLLVNSTAGSPVDVSATRAVLGFDAS